MFFLPLDPQDNLYCLSCHDYYPTKDKPTDRPVSVQWAKTAGLITNAPKDLDAAKILILGWADTFHKHLKNDPL